MEAAPIGDNYLYAQPLLFGKYTQKAVKHTSKRSPGTGGDKP